MITECLNCGKKYDVKPSLIKANKMKFCSNDCRKLYKKPKCIICGKMVARRDRKYCSRECFYVAQKGVPKNKKDTSEAEAIINERKAERARNQAEQA